MVCAGLLNCMFVPRQKKYGIVGLTFLACCAVLIIRVGCHFRDLGGFDVNCAKASVYAYVNSVSEGTVKPWAYACESRVT